MTLWGVILFMSVGIVHMFNTLSVPTTFFIFSGITMTGGVVFSLFMKETRNLTKDELANLYSPKTIKRILYNPISDYAICRLD